MNLIVFDLEWNMGNAPKTFNYHGAELTLRGEIIQIGAVRVDENGDVLDTFEMTLRPRIFRKLHWRIAEDSGHTSVGCGRCYGKKLVEKPCGDGSAVRVSSERDCGL